MIKQLYIIGFLLFAFLSQAQQNDFVYLQNKKLIDSSGNEIFIKGVNYVTDFFDDGAGLQLRAHHGYGVTNGYDCNTQTTCWDKVDEHFKFIHDSLKCNTVRIFIGHWNGPDSCKDNSIKMEVKQSTPPYYHINSYTDLSFMIPYYEHILDIAEQNNLYAILLLGGSGGTCGNLTLDNIYNSYLSETALALKDKKALLAYDMFNEPNFYNKDKNFNKAEVCNMSSGWYNLMKANDPNHLITIGLSQWGLGLEASEWSPDVYKADFFAFHIYMSTRWRGHYNTSNSFILDHNDDYGDLQAYKNRFNTAIKWISENVSTPWLLGEAGFRASPNAQDSLNDGTMQQQADFLTHTLQQTVYAGGMGMLWWQYKDVYWGIPEDPGLDYFGLVRRDIDPPSIKPAGYAMANFSHTNYSGSLQPYPAGYSNPIGNSGKLITGTVRDSQTGLPIKGAVVYGHHLQPNTQDPSKTDYTNYTQTITDENGNFNLYSMTPEPSDPPSSTAINRFLISAIGYGAVTCNQYGSLFPICEGQTWYLNKAFFYDQNYEQEVVGAQYGGFYSAPNTLCLNNLLVDYVVGLPPQGPPNPISKFTAGREVCITGESWLANGESELYISTVPVDCNDFEWNFTNRLMSTEIASKEVKEFTGQKEPTIHLRTFYLLPQDANKTNLYPNPVSDKLHVESEKMINFIMLFDVCGKQVLNNKIERETKTILNMQALTPGVYTLKLVYTDNTYSITKIIKS